jgi:hypothetical protein
VKVFLHLGFGQVTVLVPRFSLTKDKLVSLCMVLTGL